MFRKFLAFFAIVISVNFLISCGGKQTSQEPDEEEMAEEMQAAPTVTLTEVTSPKFPDAALEMNEPLGESSQAAGNVNFEFNVKNYELGIQTSDAATKNSANSAKGQHIHLIVNGEPYTALYEPSHTTELTDGNYVVLAFLSRSYHESLKHYGAYVLRQFTVGEVEAEHIDMTQPLLFFSRPKGTYQGSDTERVILDFYLINTELSADGNKVRATINGEAFIIDKWAPYFMEGLPMGDNTVKLELIDSNGNLIDGPFNSVERTFTLTQEAI